MTDDTDTPNDMAGPVSFAALFNSSFGKDGFKDSDDNDVEDADALAFSLSITGGNGTPSGLVDVLTGDAILLRVNASGDIEGYLSSARRPIAFTIDLIRRPARSASSRTARSPTTIRPTGRDRRFGGDHGRWPDRR